MVDLAVRMFRRYPNSFDPLSEHAIVLVDEIDLHLYPRWQRTIMSFLSDRFPNTQFIVTAHSPLVVQAAKDANIVLLRREGDRVIIDQYGKCCYCERRVGDKGDVEHFRPKGAVQQASGTPLIKPGYYWLAYDWNNLYLSCSVCNQHHKQNHFLLEDPETRVLNHKGKIEKESRLIIDPSHDNPEAHIGFRGASAYELTPSGKATISVLQLNHVILEDDRLNYLKYLKICYKILKNSKKTLKTLS